jgi:single-strand DNA-binding protein
MSSINTVILSGVVDRDPEVRTAPYNPNERLARFSLMTTKKYQRDGTFETKKSWHRLLIKRENLIPVVENYVKKDMHLIVTGELRTRVSTQNQQRYTEIVVSDIRLGVNNGSGISASNDVDDSLNIIVLGGHVGSEPECRTAMSNPELQITKFAVATKRVLTIDGNKQEQTTWHDIYTMKDRLQEQVKQVIRKGSYCIVVGELTTRRLNPNPESAETEAGPNKYITEVNLQRIITAPSAATRSQSHNPYDIDETPRSTISNPQEGSVDFADDSIPFDDFLDIDKN